MAHVDKYTKGQVVKLIDHCQRSNANYSNKEIDLERTHLNYALCDKGASYALQYAKEHKALNRDDVKIIASWVITKPVGIDDKELDQFFKESYSFLCERYGVENRSNIIGAYIHMDETTPHMHFSFVPCTWNEKKQINKVNAKGVITKKDLASFHDDLNKHMTKVFGRDIGIKNGITEQNKTVAELKAATQIEKDLNVRIEAIELVPSDKINLLNYKSQFEKLNEKVNLLTAENEVLKTKNSDLQYALDMAQIRLNRNHRSVSKKKIAKLEKYEEMESLNKYYEQRNTELEKRIHQSVPKSKYNALVSKCNELQSECTLLREQWYNALNWIKDHLKVPVTLEKVVDMVEKHTESKLERKAKSRSWDLER